MTRRVLVLVLPVLLGSLAIPSPAQFSTNPVKTAYQLRVPVWGADSNETLELANFRLHLDYRLPPGPGVRLIVGDAMSLDLPGGKDPAALELTYEHAEGNPALVSASINGAPLLDTHEVLGSATAGTYASSPREAAERFRLDGEFTLAVRFRTREYGTLVSKCLPEKNWAPDAKALFVDKDGRLVYDIGWVGALRGGPKVNDGEPHLSVLVVGRTGARLFLDNQAVGQKRDFSAPDIDGHVFKIGRAAPDFGLDFRGGVIEGVRYWNRALPDGGRDRLMDLAEEGTNGPTFTWSHAQPVSTFENGVPGIPVTVRLEGGDGLQIEDAWVQPLDKTDHAGLITRWSEESLYQGEQVYRTLCVTCHGTADRVGSLPTALKFHEGQFRNGSDPYRMFQTLSNGFGMMVPQLQYTAEEKYAVIHYIRETLLRPHNPDQLFPIDEHYLHRLPVGMRSTEEIVSGKRPMRNVYEQMDFGPCLMWTYQVDRGTPLPDANIAYKGIAVRLDPGKGGISRGRAWMVFDHDTMRMAAACTGDSFVDWKGIAFDGSHGTHTSLAGDLAFANPVGPGWAHPTTQRWEDTRLRGRDGKPYGPLPRDWAHYRGLYLHGDQVVLSYSVGKANILESPGWIDYGAIPIFTRTLTIQSSPHPLTMRVAPVEGMVVRVVGADSASLEEEDGFFQLRFPPTPSPIRCRLFMARTTEPASIDAFAAGTSDLPDLEHWIRGGPRRWPEILTTQADVSESSEAFAVDTLTLPDHTVNPWHSWMRLGGFDFFEDGKRAAVCTWNGDVWIVDGIGEFPGELRWQRIAAGLFQPLGLKIVDDTIYVACRDQIARLHDLNGDQEIDFVENFNNDHQVTEHFHEFAMGLQRDDEGHFYYAKSARHALPALVPHHGTLLRVSPDGSRTDILATGFRAANGVCLNPDGSFFVTDQEGHWTPENRINYVTEGSFYGNMMGYHDVVDTADDAMEQPLCWINNQMDRSPAELCWVPNDGAWGRLGGTLLNTSYGQGKLYVVPHEFIRGQPQGGVCALPLEPFDTGVMRARFHPGTGQLYGLGLFGWAGNQQAPGGFYRIRYTGNPAYLPVGLEAKETGMVITFSDPLEPASATVAENYRVKTWSLKRTGGYGSDNHDEKILKVRSVELGEDRCTVSLGIPDIHPTWCMEITCQLVDANGEPIERIIHNTVHRLGQP